MKTITRLALLLFSSPAFSQAEDTMAFKTVKALLVAMETNDSTLAASLFTSDAVLYTVHEDQDGKIQTVSIPAQRLIEAFGR